MTGSTTVYQPSSLRISYPYRLKFLGEIDFIYAVCLALELPHGSYALRVLLFIRPEAASKARRDATPLRLISWLSYKLNPELEQFIEKAMEHLSTWTETEGGKVLTMGKEAIPQGETINSEVELRDQLIDLISVGNLKHKPKALFTLFRQFLTRISLPRLIHFMDLVLPQLTPVQAAWAGEEKTLWSCHHIRWLRERQSDATPRVQISYFFSSHDNVHHVRIQWNSNPLLLFSDTASGAFPPTSQPHDASATPSDGVAQGHGHPHLLCD